MTDWGLVAEIAGGGFGVTILALIILSLVAWIVGFIIQKTKAKPAETPKEEKK
jgi:Na+-transporting methylmalonyl-CoA/oxaloacetate decarboxylase gamma subunit